MQLRHLPRDGLHHFRERDERHLLHRRNVARLHFGSALGNVNGVVIAIVVAVAVAAEGGDVGVTTINGGVLIRVGLIPGVQPLESVVGLGALRHDGAVVAAVGGHQCARLLKHAEQASLVLVAAVVRLHRVAHPAGHENTALTSRHLRLPKLQVLVVTQPLVLGLHVELNNEPPSASVHRLHKIRAAGRVVPRKRVQLAEGSADFLRHVGVQVVHQQQLLTRILLRQRGIHPLHPLQHGGLGHPRVVLELDLHPGVVQRALAVVHGALAPEDDGH